MGGKLRVRREGNSGGWEEGKRRYKEGKEGRLLHGLKMV